MKKIVAVISTAALLTFLAAGRTFAQTAQATQSTQPKPAAPQKKKVVRATDSRFMINAAQDGQAEMDLAALADSKGENPAVKQVAAKIKSDHEMFATDLKALATQKDVALPSSPNAAQKATKTRLDKLTGAAFDRAYAAQIVADHRHAVAVFTTAASSTDADVKAFAEKALPLLKDHLQRSIDLQKTLVK